METTGDTTREAVPAAAAPAVMKLCLNCLGENEESAHFCRHCCTPLDSYAATAPLESVWAECDTYLKAAKRPRSLMVVVGMVLLMGPAAFIFLWTVERWLFPVADSWRSEMSHTDARSLVLGFGVLGIVQLAVLVKTIRNYVGQKFTRQEETPDTPANEEEAEFFAEAEAAGAESA